MKVCGTTAPDEGFSQAKIISVRNHTRWGPICPRSALKHKSGVVAKKKETKTRKGNCLGCPSKPWDKVENCKAIATMHAF